LPILPHLISLTVQWISVIEPAARRMAMIGRGFPDLARRLREVVERTDGLLVAHKTILQPDADSQCVEQVEVGRLAGPAALSVSRHLARLQDCKHTLAVANHELKLDNLADATLQRHLRNTGDAIESLRQAADANNAVLAFLSPQNVDLIQVWVREFPAIAERCLDAQGTLGRIDEKIVESWEVERIERVRISKKRARDRNKRLKLEALLNAARKNGSVRALFADHPHDFTLVVTNKRKLVRRTEKERVVFPDSAGLAHIRLAELEQLTGPLKAPTESANA
jgi:hypothetical protein